MDQSSEGSHQDGIVHTERYKNGHINQNKYLSRTFWFQIMKE